MQNREQDCIAIVTFLISIPAIAIIISAKLDILAQLSEIGTSILSAIFSPLSILTLLLIYFAYSRSIVSNPRTKLIDYDFDNPGDFGIRIKNVGETEAIFRVRVWIDGEPPINESPEEFQNCLFAEMPVPAPGGGAEYPKRTKIAKGDFRQFRNIFLRLYEVHQIKIPRAGGSSRQLSVPIIPERHNIIKLPTTSGGHDVIFRVQQSGEIYAFTYQSDGNSIDQGTVRWQKHGGRTIRARIQKYFPPSYIKHLKNEYPNIPW